MSLERSHDMCRDFSCICPHEGSVIWEFGVSGHDDLLYGAGLTDNTADPKLMVFARVEIVPDNKDYRHPDKWVLHVDEKIRPKWWSAGYEAACWDAHKQWCRQLYAILDTTTVIVHPFIQITPPQTITEAHIALLRQWDSVRDSVRKSVMDSVSKSMSNSVGESVSNSVSDSVSNSVRKSVGNSVERRAWDSVMDRMWNSVMDSVMDSACAQVGSLYRLPREAWKYTNHLPAQPEYPFQAAVDLWNLGLVRSEEHTSELQSQYAG
jgi:hypothetical protein